MRFTDEEEASDMSSLTELFRLHGDRLQSFWDSIDADPEVQKRREAFEKAKEEGRLQTGSRPARASE